MCGSAECGGAACGSRVSEACSHSMPGHGRSKFGLLCIVPLWFLPCTLGAVIEVTAGGVVSDPTYRFSDASGMELATLIGNATALIASGDVVTGDGNSISAMANKIAALQTQVDALQTIISTTAYVGARLYPTHNAQQTFTNQVGAVVTLDLVELTVLEQMWSPRTPASSPSARRLLATFLAQAQLGL